MKGKLMTTAKRGRRAGSRNQGFFFWKGRGWVETATKRLLLGENGQPIREKNGEGKARAKEAFGRLVTERAKQAKESGLAGDSSPLDSIMDEYLLHCQREDSASTYTSRSNVLFDLCTGFPGGMRKRAEAGEKLLTKDRLHEGLGGKLVKDLIPHDILKWLNLHPGWSDGGARRTAIQAVKRALNWAVEVELISRNPVKSERGKGLKAGKGRERITMFSEELQAVMLANSRAAFREALYCCIRTGARYGDEFAALQDRHVEETPDGQVWHFPPDEHKTGKKTGKDRYIYVPADIAELVRQKMAHHKGYLFRNSQGKRWTREALKSCFERLCEKLRANGHELHTDICMYSCRHTYAYHTLRGTWTGVLVGIEDLAELMGNTAEVCYKHYAKRPGWYTKDLWRAVGGKAKRIMKESTRGEQQ